VCPVPADVTGPSGFPALLASGGVSLKLASLKQSRALIRLPLRCSAVPQRPAQGTPPAAVDTLLSCSLSLRERAGVRAADQVRFHAAAPTRRKRCRMKKSLDATHTTITAWISCTIEKGTW